MITPTSQKSFFSDISFDDNLFNPTNNETVRRINNYSHKSCIMEPLNFTLFEQFNEYFLLKEQDINLREYFIYTKKLAPKKLLYEIINILINYSCKYESDFCIPISCISSFGINIDKKETWRNKINKLKKLPINSFDNIKKTLKSYKLKEHIDFELIRTDVIRDSQFSEHTIPIEYYITRDAFLDLIYKEFGNIFLKQINLFISKVNYYYNEYRNGMVRLRLSELKGSILNINKEIEKLSRLTEEVISSDSDFVEFKNIPYDDNIADVFSISDEEETKENEIIEDDDKMAIMGNELYKSNSDIHILKKNNRDQHLRNTIIGLEGLNNYKNIKNQKTLAATFIVSDNRKLNGRHDICTDHIFSIHKNFKNVIKSYALDKATEINTSLIEIENHIDKLVNGIEYRDTSYV